MDGLLDRSSPRRGSLTSLHRQSSGSFSHSAKPGSASSSPHQPNKSPQSLSKDLDKFTRYFIIKAVQVIVQSRTEANKKVVKTECNPTGNDWFNINIGDIPEVTERTKSTIDAEGLSIKSNWRVCCEISMRTNEGSRIVLEHWIISNKAKSCSIQKLNSGLGSPKIINSNRSSFSNNSIASNLGISPLNTSITRARNATIACTRTKLNSIDDNSFDANDENVDIKSSASCFTLSSASATNQTTDQLANTMVTSPSINSLTNNSNVVQEQSNQQQQQTSVTTATNNITNSSPNGSSSPSTSQQQRTSAMSSIYNIYNRMSLLLKTLMTTTHIVPACKLSLKTCQSESCKICYRVYSVAGCPSKQNTSAGPRGSVEDIQSCHSNSGSPNRRNSSSNSSYASVNIREFVLPDDLEHFCPFMKIGSIKTELNELEVCLSYRTDMMTSCNLLKSQGGKGMYSRILDEDCITAAKQLLAGNEASRRSRESTAKKEKDGDKKDVLSLIDEPLRPAFAIIDDKNFQDQDGEIIESVFDSLLIRPSNHQDNDTERDIKIAAAEYENNCQQHNQRSPKSRSEPIQVPEGSRHNKNGHALHHRSVSQSSTPKSATDSFVFVDLHPPFASEEQNDLNSFFHGPSPTFSHGFDSLKDVDDLTNQLAVIEANADQIDDFVDNICVSEDEENENDENRQQFE